MKINYKLYENLLGRSKAKYFAKVNNGKTYDKDAIIQRIAASGTTATPTDCLAIMSIAEKVITDILMSGDSVRLPLMEIGFSITGGFDAAGSGFESGKNHVVLKIRKGPILRDIQAKINKDKNTNVNKLDPVQPKIEIHEVRDAVSKAADALTAGGVVEVKGLQLRIEGDFVGCGLWLIDAAGTETRLTDLAENNPKRLMGLVPATLTPGKYQMRVVTQYMNNNIPASTPRVCMYDKELTLRVK